MARAVAGSRAIRTASLGTTRVMSCLLVLALGFSSTVRPPARAGSEVRDAPPAGRLQTLYDDDRTLVVGLAPGSETGASGLVVLPPEGWPAMQVSVAAVTTVQAPRDRLAATGPPAPRTASEPGSASEVGKDAAGELPGQPASLVEIGSLRGLRLARLSLTPRLRDPVTGRLLRVEGLQVSLRFDGMLDPPDPGTADSDALAGVGPGSGRQSESPRLDLKAESETRPLQGAQADDPLIDTTLGSQSLLNPSQARLWHQAPDPRSVTPPDAPASRGPIWNLSIVQEGMAEVSGAELAAAGMDIAAVDPRSLQLYQRGRPLALWLEGEADGRLDPEDRLRFFARPAPTREHAGSIFQLALDGAPGLRMRQRSAAPRGGPAVESYSATLAIESDLRYVSDRPRQAAFEADGRPLSRWYWRQLSAPESMTIPLALPHLAPGEWTGQLGIRLIGKTHEAAAPDHHLRASLAGHLLGEAWWDGDEAPELIRMHLTASAIRTGEPLRLEAAGGTLAEFDQFYLDRLEIEYRRDLVAENGRLVFALSTDAEVPRPTDAGSARPGQHETALPTDGEASLPTDDGQRDARLSGLEAPRAELFDVSDPYRPIRLVDWVAEEGALVFGLADSLPRAEVGSMPGEDGAESGSPFAAAGAAESGHSSRFAAAAGDAFLRPSEILARPRSALLDPGLGADYILLGDAQLLVAAEPLAAWREAEGLRVARVDLNSVYDLFSGGMSEAAAVRDFARLTYHRWASPAPSVLLLLGDGTLDPLGHSPEGGPARMPVWLDLADPWLGEVAVENAFAAVDGEDRLPDLMLGRLPASSPEAMRAMVAKILAYERSPAEGDWNRRLLFVADVPDASGDFRALSEAVAARSVPPGYAIERRYYGQDPAADRSAARTSIREAWQAGALLTQYIGHGRSRSWAGDAIFARQDIETLDNGGRLPIMLEMTCMTGRFHEPGPPALAEAALLNPSGGAVAAFAPTGFGVATGHDVMNRAFVRSLLAGSEGRLGQAALAARLALTGQAPQHLDLLETYALLGDPWLRAARPEELVPPPAVFLPSLER